MLLGRSQGPENPYTKSALADPGKQTLARNRYADCDDLKRESIFFQKFACLCPGTMSLEVVLRSGICPPQANIEMDLNLSKSFGSVQHIKISLVLDLKVLTLFEPRSVVEHITKELGSEQLCRGDIERNSDGKILVHTFHLSKI